MKRVLVVIVCVLVGCAGAAVDTTPTHVVARSLTNGASFSGDRDHWCDALRSRAYALFGQTPPPDIDSSEVFQPLDNGTKVRVLGYGTTKCTEPKIGTVRLAHIRLSSDGTEGWVDAQMLKRL